MEEPSNPDMRLRLAQVLRLQGNIDNYMEAVLDVTSLDPGNLNVAAEARSAALDALYWGPPTGFQYALRSGTI